MSHLADIQKLNPGECPFHDVSAEESPRRFSVVEETEAGSVRRTNCHYCGYCCAFLATVKEGKVVDLRPDPSRYPYSETILNGCRRWRMHMQELDSPRRVNFPLKRVGQRGDGQYERISWDQALDEIAAKLTELANESSPATLASMIGGPHTSFWPLHRFMNLLGSPNNMGIGQICWNPRIWMDVLTFGWTVEADIVPGTTDTVIIWGTNPAESDNSAFWRMLMQVSKDERMKLIVVDPRRTKLAAKADVWVPLRPGADIWFALSLLHTLVEEDLVNHEFVNAWCHGYDELAAHVMKPEFAPEAVAETCGLDAELIREVARAWGNANAGALVSGRGVDQVGVNVSPTHRAICCLRALRGFVDEYGCCVLAEQSDFVSEFDLEMTDFMTAENKARCLNTPHTPLQCYEGFEYVRTLTEKLGRTLPERYLSSAHPDLVLHAMETGEPYPVRALFVQATNPLITYADTHRTYKALMGLDLLVVLEYYMTPTAQIADYVLPSAGAIERPLFQQHGGVANMVYGGPAAVEPYYERKCDYEFFRELGVRLGQAEYWPEETFEDAIEMSLAKAGMSWDEYCTTGIYHRQPWWNKHEMSGDDNIPYGFATTTGKIELASETLDHFGGQRVPTPGPLLSLCSPELREKGAHLAMITGSRKQPYNASMYMNHAEFRKRYPIPLADMSQTTADKLGLAKGDVIVVATDQGQAKFQLDIVEMVDDLINVDYGWWHPEWGLAPDSPQPETVGGMWESNINCCTRVCLEEGEPMIGTWWYNAIDCVIWKTDEELSFA